MSIGARELHSKGIKRISAPKECVEGCTGRNGFDGYIDGQIQTIFRLSVVKTILGASRWIRRGLVVPNEHTKKRCYCAE